MKTLLRTLLILALICVITAAVAFGAIMVDYPVKNALLAVGFLGAALLVLIVSFRLIIRYRAKKRVEKLVNIQSPTSANTTDNSKARTIDIKSFENRFKSVIRYLRSSKMGSSSNGLYTLPWFLMIGTETSAKANVISAAKLSTPSVVDQSLTTKDGGSNWWLYNEAVVIDTAADYVTNNSAKPEWRRLLQMLGRYRDREPVNGVVVVVSVSDLQSHNKDTLHELGKAHRQLLDELMILLKISVPVYLVVSECQKLDGFSAWAENIPESLRFSPIGIARENDIEAHNFVNKATLDISERVKELMLLLVKDGDVNTNELKFPSQIENIKTDVMAFSGGLFQPSAYQEMPNLRGIYLVGDKDVQEHEQVRKVGLFSQQIFTRLLPQDRRVVSSLTFSDHAHAWMKKIALSGWSVGVAAMLMAVGTTYYRHSAYLDNLHHEYAGKFVRQASIDQNIYALNRAREMILTLSDTVGGWWMPWFSELGEPSFIEKIKYTFTERVHEEVLVRINENLNKQLKQQFYQSESAPDDKLMTDYVAMLARRINVLLARIEGKSLDKLKALPKPFSGLEFGPEMADQTEVANQLNDIYLHALVWTADEDVLNHELSQLQNNLVELVSFGGDELQWVITWGKALSAGDTISLHQFWNGSGELGNVTVDGVFTVNGRERIETFLEQLLKTYPESADVEYIGLKFRQYYYSQYLHEWAEFANAFNRGLESLKGRDEWLQAVESLASQRNPYLRLLNKMYDQVLPVAVELQNPPLWTKLLADYQTIRQETKADNIDNTKRNKVLTGMAIKGLAKFGSAAKVAAKQAKGVLKAKKKLDKASEGGALVQTELEVILPEASQLLTEYRQGINDIAFNAETRSVSYRAMKSFFSDPENPGAGEGPEARVFTALRKLQTLLGKDSNNSRPFWAVLSGPLTLSRFYMVEEAACHLQSKWMDGFLTSIEGVPAYKLPQLIYGDGGKLWSFMDTDAGSFVKRKYSSGYVASKANGVRVPFTNAFLEFASRGKDGMQARQDSYNVQVKALPTSVNADAKYHPSETVLTLNCPDTQVKLENFNFPIGETFNWSDTCDSVSLTIKVNRMELQHTYSGPLAFPNFLKDYRSGQKRYVASQFPAYIDRLDEYGIDYIDVKYDIRGAQNVINSIKTLTVDPPRYIASCWQNNDAAGSVDLGAFTYE